MLVSVLIACGVGCAGTLIALNWKGSRVERERVANGAHRPAAVAPTAPAAHSPASALAHSPEEVPAAPDLVAPPGPTLPMPGEKEAWAIAKILVKAALESPSSADFGSSSKQKPNCGFIDDSWSCSGWVDAKNSAGATLRRTFIIAIRWAGKGDRTDPRTWDIVAAPQLTVP